MRCLLLYEMVPAFSTSAYLLSRRPIELSQNVPLMIGANTCHSSSGLVGADLLQVSVVRKNQVVTATMSGNDKSQPFAPGNCQWVEQGDVESSQPTRPVPLGLDHYIHRYCEGWAEQARQSLDHRSELIEPLSLPIYHPA